jgi:hypothetical protein
MLVTQKPKYDDAQKSAHLTPTTRCQRIPLKCVFTVNGLWHIKKNVFSWLVVLPKPTKEPSYYKPGYWAQGSMILKEQQICQSYGKIWY